MQIVAPRRTLTLATACLAGAGVLIQWLLVRAGRICFAPRAAS